MIIVLLSVACILALIFSILAVFSNGGTIRCTIDEKGTLPKKISKCGYLLFNNLTSSIKIKPGERREITTGVKAAFHPGIYGIVTDLPHSVVAYGLTISTQVYDDPGQEIKVIVINVSTDNEIVIQPNEPIGKLSFVQGTQKYI